MKAKCVVPRVLVPLARPSAAHSSASVPSAREIGADRATCFTGGQGGQRARPSARSNAGSGWLVGMGRYISSLDPLANGHEIYEAPDGGDHRFDGIRLTDSASGACMSVATTDADRCPLYTLDGT